LLRFLFPLALLGLFTASAFADVDVTFHSLGLGGNVSGVNYMKGNSYVPLDVGQLSISNETYSYSGKAVMDLYRLTTVNGQSKMVRIGGVTFPEHASGLYEALLLGQADGSVNGVAVSLKASDFPLQSVRIINTTPLALNVLCSTPDNNSAVALRPGASGVVKMPGQNRFGVSVRILRNGAMDEIGNGLYPMSTGYRDTIFIILSNVDQLQKDPKAEPDAQLMMITDAPESSSSSSNRSN